MILFSPFWDGQWESCIESLNILKLLKGLYPILDATYAKQTAITRGIVGHAQWISPTKLHGHESFKISSTSIVVQVETTKACV